MLTKQKNSDRVGCFMLASAELDLPTVGKYGEFLRWMLLLLGVLGFSRCSMVYCCQLLGRESPPVDNEFVVAVVHQAALRAFWH
jgi:hypothetical protein